MCPCRFKSLMGKNYFFLYTSSIAWNILPCCIKQMKVKGVLRKEVKEWLFYHLFKGDVV